MESNPTVTKNPNRWRLACAGGCIGFLAGACLGALDGLLALFNSGLVFENPVVDFSAGCSKKDPWILSAGQ